MLLPFLAAGVLTLAAAPAQTAATAQPAALPAPAAPAIPAVPAAAAEDSNRRICKRSAATGSLIATRRECRTAAEWTRLAEAGQNHAGDIVERGRMGGMNNN